MSDVCEARVLTSDEVSATVATVAHEVKQPLAAMITNADAGRHWLDRPTPDLDEAKAAFEQIVSDGHRAAAVIDSIRAIFNHDVRTRTLLDVNALIGDALAVMREVLRRNQIVVQADLKGPASAVTGDRVQLQQVLLNLISNAVDAMASKDGRRTLRIGSKVHDGGVTISVADSGTGIAAQDFDQVFNPRFTTKTSGMGMGLSICRAIIEAHGGQLWAAANEPEGAVFSFRLPPYGSTSAAI
jgi:signal transduction histidine kinase